MEGTPFGRLFAAGAVPIVGPEVPRIAIVSGTRSGDGPTSSSAVCAVPAADRRFAEDRYEHDRRVRAEHVTMTRSKRK